jgi:hypothetical protein
MGKNNMSALRTLAAVLAAGGLVFAGAGVAAAAQPDPLPAMTISNTDPTYADTVTLSGSGCPSSPGHPAEVDILYNDIVVPDTNPTTAVPDAAGNWSVQLIVTFDAAPPDVPKAIQTFRATCDQYTGSRDYPPLTVTIEDPQGEHAYLDPSGTGQEPPKLVGCVIEFGVWYQGLGKYTVDIDHGAQTHDLYGAVSGTPSHTVQFAYYSYRIDGSESAVPLAITGDDPPGTVLDAVTVQIPAATAAACRQAGTMSASVPAGTVIVPGGQIPLTASGFYPGENVLVELHSTPVTLTTLVADGSGTATGSATIPTDTAPGAHRITLTGQQSGAVATVDITVAGVAPTTTTTAPTTSTTAAANPTVLASTGIDATGLGLWSVGLLTAGGAVLALARIRRHKA